MKPHGPYALAETGLHRGAFLFAGRNMPNRIIKESIWTSESLSRCSLQAQGFFLRLLPLPDDHGCFDARPAILKGRLFPLVPKVTTKQISGWLKELAEVDIIRLWVASNGVEYGFLPKWSEHQRIRSLHGRKTPEPPKKIVEQNQEDVNCRQLTANDRLNLNLNPNLNLNKENMSRRTSTPQTLEDFISALKENPAYRGIDIDKELAKMDAWLLTPKGRKRRKTHKFILNWLNSCEVTLSTNRHMETEEERKERLRRELH
jgi:hypothetical protein